MENDGDYCVTADGKKIDLYREYHKNPAVYPGNSLYDHIADIGKMVAEVDAYSVLDYGCGKGTQYANDKMHRAWKITKLALYDPAVPKFEKRPEGKFDLVVCTDVLEHVPEDEIPGVLEDIDSYAAKAVFFSICTRKAWAVLPNGENAHCTIKSKGWWSKTVYGAFVGKIVKIVFSR